MPFIKAIVYSNFWIALCAGLCAWQTYWLSDLSPDWRIIGILFFATWARYNIICFTMPTVVTAEKFRFMKANSHWLKTTFFCSIFICLALFFTLDWATILFLGHLGFITFWYLFPLPLGFKKLPPLRRTPFLKIFLIAYVWSSGVYLLPLLHEAWSWNTLIGFLERLLFLFAITLPFDMKDLEEDTKMQLKTIPSQIGVQKAKAISAICLLIGWAVSGWAYGSEQIWPLGFGYLTALLLTIGISPNRKEIYYLGGIDGTMAAQWLGLLVWKTWIG